MSVPIPHPSILDDLIPVKGRRRWRNADGSRIVEGDALHGEVEVNNAPGAHLGAISPTTGMLVKEAVKGRRIDV